MPVGYELRAMSYGLSHPVHFFIIVTVAAVGNRGDPGLVVQIPPDSLLHTVCGIYLGRPAQSGADFCCVNGVAAVMARTVFNVRNQ